MNFVRGDRFEICSSIGVDLNELIPPRKKSISVPDELIDRCRDIVDGCVYDMSEYLIPELRKLGFVINEVDINLAERS